MKEMPYQLKGHFCLFIVFIGHSHLFIAFIVSFSFGVYDKISNTHARILFCNAEARIVLICNLSTAV